MIEAAHDGLAVNTIPLNNFGLVDEPASLVAAERSDYPLDLPPVTKARDIAVVTASLGSCGSLEAGIIAVSLHKFRGISKCYTPMDKGDVHVASLKSAPVSRLPTNVVNETLTIFFVKR